MNRIIIIGNGFDLAHGLKTSYRNFIDWYWKKWEKIICDSQDNKLTFKDDLCTFEFNHVHGEMYQHKNFINRQKFSNGIEFFNTLNKHPDVKIHQCEFLKRINQSLETKGWVDIENEYYKLLIENNAVVRGTVEELNNQLQFLKDNLIEYLSSINIEDNLRNDLIRDIIYSPIKHQDIAVSCKDKLVEHIQNELTRRDEDFLKKMELYNYEHNENQQLKGLHKEQDSTNVELIQTKILSNAYPNEFFLPNEIMFLNFNYTNTAKLYLPTPKPGFEINHIHGELSNPESVIFGYGDELDEKYQKLSNLNDNEYLRNFKSIKYLESDRYRRALQFMDAAPYQVFIMGHSCGNSDRTFLNTLFEHKNCVSIKPYYFEKKDGTNNYLDIVQNISRNFTDMKLMRDRVVNKNYCDAFSKQ